MARIRLNKEPAVAILPRVRRLAAIIAWVTLSLWGLATWHCELEQLPGLEFLVCCHHPGQTPHQDNDCEQDGCATVESGLYMVEGVATSAPPPVMVLASGLWFPPESVSGTPLPPVRRSSAPPELLRVWHFTFRAALPPRAPSLVA